MRLNTRSDHGAAPRPDQTETPPVAPTAFDPERLSLGLIAGTFAVMLALSWQKWADPLVDFGRELYLAWRLTEGDRLYLDLAHYYSPLSPFINAAWLGLFGVSYLSLSVGNLLLLALTLALMHRLLRGIASLLATTAALLVFLLVFAFGQYIAIANYNFVSPYAHELTHGLLFSLAAAAALGSYFQEARSSRILIAGLLTGAVFLTKYEVFAASLGSSLLGLWAHHRSAPSLWARLGKDVLRLVAAATIPVALCFGLLAGQAGFEEAFRALGGAYIFLLSGQASASPFLWGLSGLGSADVALWNGVKWTLFYALATLPVAFFGRGELRLDERLYSLAAAAWPVTCVIVGGPWLNWRQSLLPLPFFLATCVALGLRRAAPSTRSGGNSTILLLNVFALLLLIRIPLNATAAHYGFALAMPGTLMLVLWAIDGAPCWVAARGLNERPFKIAVIAVVGLFALSHLQMSAGYMTLRQFALGEDGDAMKVDLRGAVVSKAVETVTRHVAADQTLVTLPEGAMVNYLSRRRSTVSHTVFHPTALSMYGESALLSELQARPPDYILAFSREIRDLREFGCVRFGEDCAQRIVAWQRDLYAPVVAGVSQGRRLFTLLVRKKDGLPAPNVDLIEVRWR